MVSRRPFGEQTGHGTGQELICRLDSLIDVVHELLRGAG